MDPRHNSEVILLSKLREALNEAYRQQQIHHEDREEFTYWQGKGHGLEEAILVLQRYYPGGGSDGIGPRSLGF